MTKLDKARAALTQAEVRTSRRSWSKGSARGEGPQRKTGVVHVRAEAPALDPTPLDHWGRKMHRCGCGRWAPSPPGYCECMSKCGTCAQWHSTAAGMELHVCEVRP